MDPAGVSSREDLKHLRKNWVEEELINRNPFREDLWTESLEVDGDAFVQKIQDASWIRAIGRSIGGEGEDSSFVKLNILTVPILIPKRPFKPKY